MVQLTSERDEAVAESEEARAVADDAIAPHHKMKAEIQAATQPSQSGHVGPLRCCLHGPLIGPRLLRQERDREIRELREARAALNRQVSDMQAKLDFASQENIAIRTAKAEIAKRLERSEGELAASREQVRV